MHGDRVMSRSDADNYRASATHVEKTPAREHYACWRRCSDHTAVEDHRETIISLYSCYWLAAGLWRQRQRNTSAVAA